MNRDAISIWLLVATSNGAKEGQGRAIGDNPLVHHHVLFLDRSGSVPRCFLATEPNLARDDCDNAQEVRTFGTFVSDERKLLKDSVREVFPLSRQESPQGAKSFVLTNYKEYSSSHSS